MTGYIGVDYVHGMMRAGYRYYQPDLIVTRPWQTNLVLKTWGAAMAPLMLTGDRTRVVATLYLEFVNVVSPDTPASIPTFDRDRTLAYYDDLAYSSDRDYLRVVAQATRLVSSGGDLPEGNGCLWIAKSSGSAGVHGKPCGAAANSKLVGGALAASPSWVDPTQDVLISASYLPEDGQLIYLQPAQWTLDWQIEFE